jgi:hypothetical protein
VRNEPALVAATTTGASFGIAALTFCSLQELCRLLRQADGPENSLLVGARARLSCNTPSLTAATPPRSQAGGATGALLRGLHHGRSFALPGALAAGALAYGAHRALDAHAAGALSSSLGVASLVRARVDACAWPARPHTCNY